MGTVMVQIPVDEATAEALADPRRLAAVTELVKLAVRPAGPNDPLIALLEQTARDAAEAGLTEADIEAELAAWKAERATRPG
jgi:hypothetical protein